jgi:hypothetical protein
MLSNTASAVVESPLDLLEDYISHGGNWSDHIYFLLNHPKYRFPRGLPEQEFPRTQTSGD